MDKEPRGLLLLVLRIENVVSMLIVVENILGLVFGSIHVRAVVSVGVSISVVVVMMDLKGGV